MSCGRRMRGADPQGPRAAVLRSRDVRFFIGRLGSSAFRLSTSTVSMSLTGSCFSSESAPRPLYGAFFCQGICQGRASFSFVGFLI